MIRTPSMLALCSRQDLEVLASCLRGTPVHERLQLPLKYTVSAALSPSDPPATRNTRSTVNLFHLRESNPTLIPQLVYPPKRGLSHKGVIPIRRYMREAVLFLCNTVCNAAASPLGCLQMRHDSRHVSKTLLNTSCVTACSTSLLDMLCEQYEQIFLAVARPPARPRLVRPLRMAYNIRFDDKRDRPNKPLSNTCVGVRCSCLLPRLCVTPVSCCMLRRAKPPNSPTLRIQTNSGGGGGGRSCNSIFHGI